MIIESLVIRMLPLIAVLTAAFLSCHWVEGAHKYSIEFKKDNPMEPCDLDAFTYIDTAFDLSDITLYRDENDNIVINGTFKLKKDVGVLEMQLEAKKFDRGNWVPMITVSKPDYCEFIISPTEGAEPVFENLEPKRCPFDTDTVYTIHPTTIKMKFDSPYPHAQGDYMAYIKIFNKQKDISTCVKFQCDVH